MRVIRDDKDTIEFAPSHGALGTQLLIALFVAVPTTTLSRAMCKEMLQVDPLDPLNRAVPWLLGICACIAVARWTQPFSFVFDRKRRVLSIVGGWRYFYPTLVEHHVREIFDLAFEEHSGDEGSSWSVELWLKWGEKKRLMRWQSEREAADSVAQLRKAIFG